MRPRRRPELVAGSGERLLAWCTDADGRNVGGTRDALYLPPPSPIEPAGTRIPWEQVESADWDADASVLTVREVGTWGVVRPVYRLTLDDPARLLQLVRERVTATVVLQRHVPIHGRRGVRVIARRAPSGDRSLTWAYEYDEGVDPADPAVHAAAEEALALAQDEVGGS